MKDKKHKLIITGTGRSGTTFLMILFTYLNLDTGYKIEDIENHISKNCGSGMEGSLDKAFIVKNPVFSENLESISKNYNIEHIIVPVRNFIDSAKSRVSHKQEHGGLWNATNLNSQVSHYNKIISNIVYVSTKYDIPVLFLDFDRLVTNYEYLYNKLSCIKIFSNISLNLFKTAFDQANNKVIKLNEDKNK
jgi:hypothetical protein